MPSPATTAADHIDSHRQRIVCSRVVITDRTMTYSASSFHKTMQ